MRIELRRAVLVVALASTGCIDWDGLYSDAATGVPLYRIHHATADIQIITLGLSEVMSATATGKWISDGTIAHVPSLPLSQMSDIYRLAKPPGTDWFFTDDVTEKDNAISMLGYATDGSGVGFSIPKAQVTPRIPLYRLSKAGIHHYAAGDDERDAQVNDGWTLERTLGFVNP
jgi:hypothetical protein